MIRLVMLSATALLLFASLPGRADDQDVIDYRTHVMKTLGEQMDAIGMILQNKAPADNFATHFKVLALAATQAKKAFEPKVPGGNAKPEVWANWADFSKRLDDLVTGTAQLSTAAQHEPISTVAGKLRGALNCKGCHDNYRKPLK